MKRIKLSKNNKIFKLSFLILLLIIFCIILVFVYKKPKTKVENNQSLETLFNQIAEQLKNTDSRTTKTDSPSGVWWIDDNNFNIYVPTNLRLSLNITANNKANEKSEYNQVFDKLNKIVKTKLTQNGFVLNTKNSSQNKNDYRLFDYIQAYELNNFVCLTTSPIKENSNWFEFNCFNSDQLKLAQEQQLPFIKILQPQLISESIISSLKINGDYAHANLNGRRVGVEAFFYKDKNDWKLIWMGQDRPMCNELSKKNIPTKFWPDCYLDQQGNIKKGSFKIN